MAKDGEIAYIRLIGEGGASHAAGKPFSDEHCAGYLVELGIIMSLLPPPPGRVLDLGCGTGWTSEFLARRGYEVVGQDLAPDMIALAEEHRGHLPNLSFVVSDYESLDAYGTFDLALFFDALHHSVDERAALRSVAKALRPGGLLVTSEPGEGHAEAETSRRAVEEFGVTERDMPPRLIIEAAEQLGFECVQVLPNPAFLHRFAYPPAPGTSRKARLRTSLVGRAALAAAATLYKPRRLGGIVVLRKT